MGRARPRERGSGYSVNRGTASVRCPPRRGRSDRQVTDRSARSCGTQSYTPGTDVEGDIDALSLWSGQSVGIVSEIKPAGDIVREIVAAGADTLRKLAK
jgi:NAD(P)H-dependent flavin oxidoreductase YrpB (nitropropane dioxygenase family)